MILGIDPGATIGLALIDYSRPDSPRFVEGSSVRGSLEAIFRMPQPDLVAIETVVSVFSRERFGAGMATALVNAARVEGRILEMAKQAGIPVLQCQAAEWRKALTGKRAPTDAQVKARLGLRMTLPRCNAHVRDAVGVALYAAQKARLDAMRAGKVA